MGLYKIEGRHHLSGNIQVHGAKNAVLPILAATLLNGGKNIIHNCPQLSDIDAMTEILDYLGCTVERKGTDFLIESTHLNDNIIPSHMMQKTRSSTLFAGALAARRGKLRISGSGGCTIGKRPIDLHLKAFSELGISVREYDDGFELDAIDFKGGCTILDFPSVGATENIMLCASLSTHMTIIYNAACEPEIVNLADFLRSIGVKVCGDGTPVIHITGIEHPGNGEVSIIGDRIVAATYAVCAIVSGGTVTVEKINPGYLSPVLAQLRAMGSCISLGENSFTVSCDNKTRNVPVTSTGPYPYFPTDSQPLMMALMSVSSGVGIMRENIFENRFGHCERLNRMGADIRIHGRCASVRGVRNLKGADVDTSDLRCGAALVCAALGADGVTTISNTHYIERGYENICRELSGLGAAIERID